MEREVIMNAFHHAYWGVAISIYFWLVGASAGSFVISSLGWVFGIKRYKPIAIFACITAIILLLIVPVLLIWDLGRPARFFHLLTPGFWHSTSPMAWGTLLVASYPVAMMVYVWFVYKENAVWARITGLISVVLALSTHWYTGVVMELNPSRHPNHTAMAPIIFLTGAYISGIGLLIMLLYIRNFFLSQAKKVSSEMLIDMGRLMAFGVGFDMFLIFSEFLQMTYGNEEEFGLLFFVLLDVFRFPYLWVEIVFGLIVPFFILFSPLGRRIPTLLLASFLITVGVYGMRIWWVLGGQFLQPYF